MGVVEQHKIVLVKVAESEPLPTARISMATFSTASHLIPLHKADDITGRATWPCYTPTSSHFLYAAQVLPRMIRATSAWDTASSCWKSVLFKAGTIIQHHDTGEDTRVIGSVANILVLGWRVTDFELPTKDGVLGLVSAAGTGECMNSSAVWLSPLDIDNYDVVPTVISSPIHLYLVHKRKIHKYSGIVLVQTVPTEDLHTHVARHCFYDCPLHQLKTLCKEFGLCAPSRDLLGHLQALVACLLFAPVICG